MAQRGPRRSLRVQLATIGVGAVATTAVLLTGIGGIQTAALAARTGEDVAALNEASLDEITSQAHTLVSTQVATLTERMAAELNIARQVVATAGAATLGSPVAWTAKNQVTGQTQVIALPELRLGGQDLGQNSSTDVPTPIVDEITTMLGPAATVLEAAAELPDAEVTDLAIALLAADYGAAKGGGQGPVARGHR